MPRVYIPQSYSRKFMNYETELPFIDYMRSLVEYSIQIPYDMRSGIGLRSRVNRAMSNAGRQTMQKWRLSPSLCMAANSIFRPSSSIFTSRSTNGRLPSR